jgi:hypothetical protein
MADLPASSLFARPLQLFGRIVNLETSGSYICSKYVFLFTLSTNNQDKYIFFSKGI